MQARGSKPRRAARARTDATRCRREPGDRACRACGDESESSSNRRLVSRRIADKPGRETFTSRDPKVRVAHEAAIRDRKALAGSATAVTRWENGRIRQCSCLPRLSHSTPLCAFPAGRSRSPRSARRRRRTRGGNHDHGSDRWGSGFCTRAVTSPSGGTTNGAVVSVLALGQVFTKSSPCARFAPRRTESRCYRRAHNADFTPSMDRNILHDSDRRTRRAISAPDVRRRCA